LISEDKIVKKYRGVVLLTLWRSNRPKTTIFISYMLRFKSSRS